MKVYKSIQDIAEDIGDSSVFMIVGNSGRNQFRYLRDLKRTIRSISKSIPSGSYVLYFGDSTDKKTPTIGYGIQYLNEIRKDIKTIMIHLLEAKEWGDPPSFVNGVLWNKDYPKKGDCKWGGVDPKTKKPCSNTKQWVKLHHILPNGIQNIFIVGGGPVTLNEVTYAKKLNIPMKCYHIDRRFKGDRKTRVKNKDSKKERIGLMYGFRCNKTRKVSRNKKK